MVNAPLSETTHAIIKHHGVKQVPWTLEQTPMPASGCPAGHHGVAEGEAVTVDSIVALARSAGFDDRFQLSLPSGAADVCGPSPATA